MKKDEGKTGKRIKACILFGTGLFAFLSVIGNWKKKKDHGKIDDGNAYLDASASASDSNRERRGKEATAAKSNLYLSLIKPLADKTLSFFALLLLSPLLAIISLAIVIDDPGPVFFTQKRVGKGKHFFKLYKFRSMKMSTPHDVPTHLLEDPDQYITRVGKFIRKYSLDELPQIWNIFVGDMSIIGPRPALWNQEDLIAERDKYGANDILPGLTGWAQINGRDELEIPVKAKLDGDYCRAVRKNSISALRMDLKCFFGTFKAVSDAEGVVEGGTGELHKQKKEMAITPDDAGFDDYGCCRQFDIDRSEENKKAVLITGASSYIGESFREYVQEQYPDNFTVDTLSLRDESWKDYDFSRYDAVFHVAGITHADISKVSPEDQKNYYSVNRNLAIETARIVREEGVKQFIYMSSAIIYGDSAPYGKDKEIGETTLPHPSNFYGDSKWQGELGVRKLNSDSFHVAVIRSPMVYGKGSKGNYQTLRKIAKKFPIFPDIDNHRSMIYIGNLCEFVALLILSGEDGIYFPQNREYSTTSDLVRMIAEASGKHIVITKALNPLVKAAAAVPVTKKLVDKAFGNLTYEQRLSSYDGLVYQNVSLKESIQKSEN